MQPTWVAFTDGSVRKNGPGSYYGAAAYVLLSPRLKFSVECAFSAVPTTISRMEASAVIAAIEKAMSIERAPLTVYCDSQYIVNSVMVWRHKWKRSGWMRGIDAPVRNVDLMKKLDELMERYSGLIELIWLRGHNGNAGNERADELATTASMARKMGQTGYFYKETKFG